MTEDYYALSELLIQVSVGRKRLLEIVEELLGQALVEWVYLESDSAPARSARSEGIDPPDSLRDDGLWDVPPPGASSGCWVGPTTASGLNTRC